MEGGGQGGAKREKKDLKTAEKVKKNGKVSSQLRSTLGQEGHGGGNGEKHTKEDNEEKVLNRVEIGGGKGKKGQGTAPC